MLVYVLVDPRDGDVRYVGQTRSALNRRLRSHLCKSGIRGRGHRQHWLKAVLASGQKPVARVLQRLSSEAEMNAAEVYWIKFFRENGCNLTNSTEGGDGGRNPSAETRALMSAAKFGKTPACALVPKSEATRERIRQSLLGKRASPETRARQSAARRGRTNSPVTRQRISAATRGRKVSSEGRERMRVAAQLRESKKRQRQSSGLEAGEETWSSPRQ